MRGGRRKVCVCRNPVETFDILLPADALSGAAVAGAHAAAGGDDDDDACGAKAAAAAAAAAITLTVVRVDGDGDNADGGAHHAANSGDGKSTVVGLVKLAGP